MKLTHRWMCIVFLTTTAYANTYKKDDRGDLSRGDEPILVKELPADLQVGFSSVSDGISNILGGICFGVEPDYTKIDFLLYANNTESYTRLDLNNYSGLIDNNATLYILTHGWVSGLNGYRIKKFRDTYVRLYGKNVLFINYGRLAWYPYVTVACDIPFIGQHVAEFLCGLNEKQGYDLRKVHMIGHSLGGQLAGLTGKGVKNLCNQKMGRITALDPAGPLFNYYTRRNRLIAGDAELVEVVHSNSGVLGFLGKAGDVDYHLNCGTIQPGCILPNLGSVADASIFYLTCSHLRSVEIWPYVLESQLFKAKSCTWCSGLMPASCFTDFFRPDYVTLGHTKKKPPSSNYNVVTRSVPPFSFGCIGYRYKSCI